MFMGYLCKIQDNCKFRYKEKQESNIADKGQPKKEEYCLYSSQHKHYKQHNMNANSVHIATDGSGGVIINNSNSLVAEQVTDISLQQNVRSKTKDAINNLKTKLYIPPILLFSLSGIFTLIFAFHKALLDNHILVEGLLFFLLWLLLLIIPIIVWCILFFCYKEKMEQKLSEFTLEPKQNDLFEKFIDNLENNCFRKDDFTKYISTEISQQLSNIGKFKKINEFLVSIATIEDISQDISNLIINKAINKEIIVAVNTDFLFDCYMENKKGQDFCDTPFSQIIVT